MTVYLSLFVSFWQGVIRWRKSASWSRRLTGRSHRLIYCLISRRHRAATAAPWWIWNSLHHIRCVWIVRCIKWWLRWSCIPCRLLIGINITCEPVVCCTYRVGSLAWDAIRSWLVKVAARWRCCSICCWVLKPMGTIAYYNINILWHHSHLNNWPVAIYRLQLSK